MAGTLYVVATPIGNLEDITFRAARTLAQVSVIACEDTRQTRKLLDHLGIRVPLISYHEHNERDRTPELIERLQNNESVALVTDAGTPLVSDPGYRVVEAAVAAGVAVTPIPGPSAMLAALSASGLPTDAVWFGGFLPPQSGKRKRVLETIRDLEATAVFYEAPHRVVEALADIEAVLGDRRVVCAREITKMHEEFLRGRAAECRKALEARDSVRGEFTILIAKSDGAVAEHALPVPDAVAAYEQQGMARMDAIKRVAKERKLPKRDVYKAVEG